MHNPEGSGIGPGIPTEEEHKAYWDRQARETTQRIEAQEREKEEAQQAARLAVHQEGEKALEAEREQMREAWVASGGTAAEFDREWPGTRKGIILERLRARDEQSMSAAREIWRGV